MDPKHQKRRGSEPRTLAVKVGVPARFRADSSRSFAVVNRRHGRMHFAVQPGGELVIQD